MIQNGQHFSIDISSPSIGGKTIRHAGWGCFTYSWPWDTSTRDRHPGAGSPFLLHGIFPTQELNLGLLHCRQIPYHLSHQGSLYHQESLLKPLFSDRWYVACSFDQFGIPWARPSAYSLFFISRRSISGQVWTGLHVFSHSFNLQMNSGYLLFCLLNIVFNFFPLVYVVCIILILKRKKKSLQHCPKLFR